jgi:phi13 family phage major tail protein
MATIGLDKLYYAIITEGTGGVETYGTPKIMAKAISAELAPQIAEATLYADDGAAENVKEFTSATFTLGVDDLASDVMADLLGVTVDQNGVVVSTPDDAAPYVAVGFRAKRSNGKYQYFWLYRVKFGVPNNTLATKGESITFNTPSIVGTVMRRNKADGNGRHPWKVDVVEGATGVEQTVVDGWYSAVYEPDYSGSAVSLSDLTIGSINLSPTFDADVKEYTAATSNATNTITATLNDNTADVVITVNGDSLTNGGSASWETGENTVNITVTKGTSSKKYTVIVTKS